MNDPSVLKVFTGQNSRIWTPQELTAVAVSHPPLFAPGAEYSYSNTNCVALGLILQKATGQSLATPIQDRIARHWSLASWGVLAGTARNWLVRSPRRLSWIGGASAVVMVGLDIRLALNGRD